MKKILISVLLMFILLFTSCEEEPDEQNVIPDVYTITSPYSNVNWATDGQFKAALHAHTSNSHNEVTATLTQIVDEHYKQDYDILALTDHNHIYGGLAQNPSPLNKDWVDNINPMTQARFDEVTTGVGRNSRGILPIPNTSELLISPDEINTYFFPHTLHAQNGEAALRNTLTQVQNAGGIAQMNHPGRVTGGSAIGAAGEAASNNPTWINKYSGLFEDFPCLVGMEIINRNDADSRGDRILWDNILKVIIPKGQRNVWGFSNDDSHSTSAIGNSFNIFVMPENTLENVKSTMINGNFYAVTRTAGRELGNQFTGTGPTPTITNIVITNNVSTDATITITAENVDVIKWISNGVEIAEGASITLGSYADNIGVYVRANIIGSGGIVFTQPFIVTK